MAKSRLHRPAPRVAAAPSRLAAQPKYADPIYRTPEYQAWRAKVVNRAGGRCQDPRHQGPNPPFGKIYADHIVELKDGGAAFDPVNGSAKCASCHTRKTNVERAKRTAATY